MKKLTPVVALGILFATTSMLRAETKTLEPEFVDSLVGPYLEIQAALASDDLAAAKDGAKTYLDAVTQAPSGAAKKDVADLRHPAQQIASAAKIDAARQHFLTLSNEMQALIKEVGTTGGTQLFVVHCPMAFSGKGGDWLQAEKTVSNPYYGKSMLRCGSIKSELGVEGSADDEMNHKSGNQDHMDHDHSSMNHPAHENAFSLANLDAVHADVPGYKPIGSKASQNSDKSSCGTNCCSGEK